MSVNDLLKPVGRALLVKVKCESGRRTEIMEIVDVFRAKVIDIGHTTLTIQITGTENKIEAFVQLMEPFGIIEVARTGKVAMLRELNGVEVE